MIRIASRLPSSRRLFPTSDPRPPIPANALATAQTAGGTPTPPARSPAASAPPEPIGFRRFLEQVYFAKFRKLRPATRKSYLIAANHWRAYGQQLAVPTPADFPLERMSLEELERFSDWLLKTPSRNGRRRRTATVNSILGATLAVRNYASQRGLAPRLEPTIRGLGPDEDDRTQKPAFTLEELQRIFRRVAALGGAVAGFPAAHWWDGLLRTLYNSALRITAVMSLGWPDLDAADRSLAVPKQFQKQARAQHVGLAVETIAALERLRRPEGAIFPWPFDPVQQSDGRRNWKTLRRTFRHEILWLAGVPDTPGDCFHRFRRTTGTLVCARLGKAEASRMLDHSGLSVTDLYIDASQLPVSRIGDCLPPLPAATADSRLPTPDPQRWLF